MPWDKSATDPIQWAAKMQDAPRDAINIFAFEVFKRVVMRTPVDTGQARSNWTVSINEEDDSVMGADVKIRKVKKRKGENAGKIVRKRTVKLERNANDTMRVGLLAINSAEGDDKIIIQNNLPYIRKLEFGGYGKVVKKLFRRKKFIASNTYDPDTKTGKTINGYSKQAPHGMVGVVLAKANQLWEAAVQAAKEKL